MERVLKWTDAKKVEGTKIVQILISLQIYPKYLNKYFAWNAALDMIHI